MIVMKSSHIELNIFLIDLFTLLKHDRNKKQRIKQTLSASGFGVNSLS